MGGLVDVDTWKISCSLPEMEGNVWIVVDIVPDSIAKIVKRTTIYQKYPTTKENFRVLTVHVIQQVTFYLILCILYASLYIIIFKKYILLTEDLIT